jgi:hypothetical protein
MGFATGKRARLGALPNRREFLRWLTYGCAGVGLLTTTSGINYIRSPLWEQYRTWQQVDCDAETFLQRFGAKLAQIHFGANLCPDYRLMAAEVDPDWAVRTLKEQVGCRHIRLGMWWSTHAQHGLSAYDRWIEALLTHGMQTLLSYGIKSPFPPETHFPPEVEQQFPAWGVKRGSTVSADSPLGRMGLAYSQQVLEHLDRTFGLENFYGFNPENEFDAHYGKFRLGIGEDVLRAQAQLLYHPNQQRRMLINTALISPPGFPASLSTAVKNAVAIKQEFPTLSTIVGADIYEETGAGRVTANAYVDTFAGVRLRHGDALIPNEKAALAAAGIPLEVTEFQISDWVSEPRRDGPGSRRHTQYLLARMADYLLDDTPALRAEPFIVRLWEMSALLLQMREDKHFFEHNDTFALIQTINQRSA